MNLDALGAAWAPRLLSVLRIMAGLLFLQHGTAKLLKIPVIPMFANLSLTSPSGIAGILELVGGVLMILGLFTRSTAFVLSGLMAVAYFMAHASKGSPLFPLMNGGEAAVLFCFVFLYISVAGGGAWSIDNLRSRR